MATDLAETVIQILWSHDLEYLRQHYRRHGLTTSFYDAQKHYVGYLLATIAADSFQSINDLQLSPPYHVDVLWHGHLLETKRWRAFEELVIEHYKESGRTTDMEHIDHSVVDNLSGRKERLQKTRSFYEVIGLEFRNDDDDHVNDNSCETGQAHFIHDSTTAMNELRNDGALSRDKRERSESATEKDLEKKSKVASSEYVKFALMDVTKEKVIFKANKKTRLSKIFSAYGERTGLDPTSLRFLFYGNNINRIDRTVEEIGLKNDDVIDVHFDQIGWSMADSKDLCEEMTAADKDREKKSKNQSRESFIITLLDQAKEKIFYIVNKETKLSKIAYEYAKRKGVAAPVVGFLFKGNYIDNIGRTMEEIGLQDEDLIEVVLEWCMTEEMWHKCKS